MNYNAYVRGGWKFVGEIIEIHKDKRKCLYARLPSGLFAARFLKFGLFEGTWPAKFGHPARSYVVFGFFLPEAYVVSGGINLSRMQ